MEEHWLEGEAGCWASLSIQKLWFLGEPLLFWASVHEAAKGVHWLVGWWEDPAGREMGMPFSTPESPWPSGESVWELGFVIVSFRRSHGEGEIAEQEDDEVLGQLCADRVSEPCPPHTPPHPHPLTTPSPHPHTPPLKLPHSQVLEDGNIIPVSAFTSRDPNGEGLPLWPAYSQSEQYLKLDLNVSVGQKLKEREVEFWSDTLPLIMSPSTALPGPPPPLLSLSLLLPFFSAPWGIVCDFDFPSAVSPTIISSIFVFSYFVKSAAFTDVLWMWGWSLADFFSVSNKAACLGTLPDLFNKSVGGPAYWLAS